MSHFLKKIKVRYVQKLRAKLKDTCFLLVDLQNCSARCSPIAPGRQNPRSFILQTKVYHTQNSVYFNFVLHVALQNPLQMKKKSKILQKSLNAQTFVCSLTQLIDVPRPCCR
jgi:hypothetical protein